MHWFKLVYYPSTFLTVAGIKPPGLMQGVNQLDVWCGREDSVREHVLVENRHNPTTVHLRTLIENRYKMTVYRNAEYGELFDLRDDPGEVHNQWNDPAYQDVRADMMHRFLQAEIQRESTRMPRIAGA